ncbi:diguanylate cyclase (GGDEF) domain-containing protein [Noviherbaspirillum humi]|uniref:Diguanylate cyclase (GGDEF) domain-containing protein n=1 Tax=Noviherbaspirillum humi TaxID=1688639 RepID=A0A239FA13_9BURK|nr:diguanylate cyclase (GGDEF) domain-containing protein [Noviherbaspirillum humi]
MAVFAWPAGCVALGIAVSVALNARLSTEKEALQAKAFSQAASLAASYAEQIGRVVGNLDQVTRSVAFQFHESGGRLQLERQANRGIYPDESALNVGIVDRHGKVATALLEQARGMDLSGRPWFALHRAGEAGGLAISAPHFSPLHGQATVNFSRALRDAEGALEGVAFVSVKQAFLTSFYDPSLDGPDDVVALLTADGAPLASSLGDASHRQVNMLKSAPRFPTPAGVASFPGDRFNDGLARIVAWRTVERYPLVSYVALTEQTVFAAHEAKQREYRTAILVIDLLLACLALVGMGYSVRLAWRKRQTEAIKDTYRLATDNAQEAFFMCRPVFDAAGAAADFIIEDCNEAVLAFTRVSRRDLIGRRLSRLYPESRSAAALEAYRGALETGFIEDEYLLSVDDAAPSRWVQRRIVRSADGLAVTLRDINEAKEHEISLSRMANCDALTGLPNRHWLGHNVPACLAQAAREKTRVAILFIDLDDFKNINNTRGHAVGDAVLKIAAERMQAIIGLRGGVARLGGDEFTVIYDRLPGDAVAVALAERMLSDLAQPFVVDEEEHMVSASIGLSIFPDHGEDMQTLFRHADVAMYAAKAAGKNGLQIYQPSLSHQVVAKLEMKYALRHAIDHDQFVLHYQPRVDAHSGELLSMEALVRWIHPSRGIVPPMEFIPLAEESGLIVDIGALVLEKACAQIAAWRAAGIPARPVSVNVSPKHFSAGCLLEQVRACLKRYDLPASLLELEITESCMLGDGDWISREMSALKAMGIRISVDDFGTGYSSLAQLQRLDIDVLKVDRAFTMDLTGSRHGVAFFKTILSIAEVLGLRVVAEGVETEQQLQILRQLACHELQGYFISRPVAAADIESHLRKTLNFDLGGRALALA